MLLNKNAKLEKQDNTVLIGKNSKLDSLGILNFITTTEQKIEEAFNVRISLTENEELIFSENGPLKSLHTLVDYISNQLNK